MGARTEVSGGGGMWGWVLSHSKNTLENKEESSDTLFCGFREVPCVCMLASLGVI
jgi:hypothetical protein